MIGAVSPRRVVVLRYARGAIVTPAERVLLFLSGQAKVGGGTVRAGLYALPRVLRVELAHFLPFAVDDSLREPVELVVKVGNMAVAFRTSALLELAELSAAFTLPRLMRLAGAPDWVCGLGFPERPARTHETTQPEAELAPALWLDLAQLGATLIAASETQPPRPCTSNPEETP